jgi:hypothetical protein
MGKDRRFLSDYEKGYEQGVEAGRENVKEMLEWLKADLLGHPFYGSTSEIIEDSFTRFAKRWDNEQV